MEGARVVELVRYPVKGCAAEPLSRVEVTSTGLVHDRMFMVVDEQGGFMSQRRQPAMAVVRPELIDGGRRLGLSAPGVEDLVIDVARDGARLEVSVFKWTGKAVDQGGAAAEWFSTVLGRACRLVRVPPDHDRDTEGETPGKTGFADAHAMLLTSLSSLDKLNGLILERGGEPVPMNRFRPNIVLSGWSEPHTEDRVRALTVGGVTLGFAKVATRCAVPTVEQSTGAKTGPEPIRTLATYRRDPAGGVTFGMKAAVVVPGEIAIGDEVAVHAWAT